VARHQHALDGGLLVRQAAQQDAPALGVAGRFLAQRALFGLQRGERAVGFGDCPLRAAQRVARLLA
jgi:hypothetical protein